MRHLIFFIVFLGASALGIQSLYAQNPSKAEGLKILNVVRSNYDSPPLRYDRNLSEYATKKAVQNLNNDTGEIIVSEEVVGLLYVVRKALNNKEIKDPMRFVSAVINFIDVDCDSTVMYDSFNQVIDDKSTKVGIGEFVKGDANCIVFVFDHYVYNEETDLPNHP